MAYDEQVSDPAAYRTGYAAQDFRSRHGLDPDEGGPSGPLRLVQADDNGRDRLGIHIGWEIILLLTVAAIGFLLYRLEPDALRRPALDTLLIWGSAIGLLALGAGLTLRAGVPNLAIGPIAVAASLHYAENGDKGLLQAGVPALIIAAIAALVVAILVISLHVPGWAATLAAALGVVVYNQLRTAPVNVQGTFDPSDQAFFLFGGFALLAVLGGATG
ncbi:MAG: ABC transporter permease, partial [Actinoplanes sp.]